MATSVVCKSGAVLLLLLAVRVTYAQQRLAVGTAVAEPGKKSTGFIEGPGGVDAGTRIPVVAISGVKPGPVLVLVLVASSHGTEYASIIALEKLITTLDPSGISGTVVIVPLVNLPSFEQKVVHGNPVDGKSMNRFYPGKADGAQTERALWAITKQVVEKCDYLIDDHGGDLDENLRPYSYWLQTGNANQDRTAQKIVLAFGLDHIVIVTDRPKDPEASKYLDNTAALRGKPTLTVEAGHAGTTDPDEVSLLVDGTFNVMRYLKMVEGKVAPVEHPVWIEKIEAASSDRGGIFYPLVQRGSYVEAACGWATSSTILGALSKMLMRPLLVSCSMFAPCLTSRRGTGSAYVGVVSKRAAE